MAIQEHRLIVQADFCRALNGPLKEIHGYLDARSLHNISYGAVGRADDEAVPGAFPKRPTRASVHPSPRGSCQPGPNPLHDRVRESVQDGFARAKAVSQYGIAVV